MFLVCGGNDLENLKNDNEISRVFEHFEDLINITKQVFPCSRINVISVIPRRARYPAHIQNMNRLNIWLAEFCKDTNIRFVDIYTFYLDKQSGYLNKSLFKSDLLHFSSRGDSIMGKVLIAVSNRPHPL